MDSKLRADLRQRLRRLGVRKGTAHLRTPPASRPRAAAPLASAIGGEEVITPRGAFHLREVTFPLDHHHGRYPLGHLLDAPTPPLSALLTPRLSPPPHVTRLAFLDTETTGLVGGTGTPAFLIGLGIVEAGHVRVRQYFLRDLHEEPAMLEALARDLEAQGIAALVTYNGRAFDLPLLQTRFLLNAIPSPLDDMAHLDLLIHTRRLWRPRLRRCTLSDVEHHILAHRRDGLDVPGWLVPHIYRDFLRTRDPEPLRQVFYHNLHDILSLIGLTDVLLRAWHDPWAEPALMPEDFVARARLLYEEGRTQEAEAALRHALRHATDPHLRHRAYVLLGTWLKRERRWADAVALWQAWVEEMPRSDLTPYEELAKYYEWQARDLDQALAWTEQGLARLGEMGRAERVRWESPFQHRLARLRRRLQKRGK